MQCPFRRDVEPNRSSERKAMSEISPKPDLSRQDGIIMLVVLWMLTSATILVASFNGAARSGAGSGASEIGVAKSDALLDAGLELAAAHLLDQDESRRWQGNGKKQSIFFAGAELSIEAWDANGLVDLNKSDRKLIKAVFQSITHSASSAERYTSAIMDEREAQTNESAPHSTGAQPSAMNTFPDMQPFVDVWQLVQLAQIPSNVVRDAAPYFTVYSRDGTIDPRAAPETVLTSIPGVTGADLVKLRYANATALSDLIQKSDGLLTDQSGPAYIVKVQCHRPQDEYSVIRTFAILIGMDPSAPYRLLAKWPPTSIPAMRSR